MKEFIVRRISLMVEANIRTYKRLATSWSFLLAEKSEVRRLVSMRPEIFWRKIGFLVL